MTHQHDPHSSAQPRGDVVCVLDAVPGPEAVEKVLRHRLGVEAADWLLAGSVELPLEHQQLLARALGWLPTPTVGEIHDDDGAICCPNCGHGQLEHVAEGPCDHRLVRGYNDAGELRIVYSHRACASEGRWWLACRYCVFEFNVPDGIEIAWD